MVKRTSRLVPPFTVLVCLLPAIVRAEQQQHAPRRGTRLFFRMVGAENNAPLLPKTHSAWTQDRRPRTATTGSSDLGFTEYPFCYGRMDFTFVEEHAIYPRLISGARADESLVNTADLVMDHVYQPDGCVWGWSGKEFVQTFVATKAELVSATLLVASEPGTFRASLVEGGPGGRQIGPAKTFESGHSMTWGTARWTAGQTPLVPGGTYGIRIRRVDGRPFTPYLHATGNACHGGMLHVDRRPHPESDLALWIVEEPGELRRAVIDGADDEGWVYRAERVRFTPRTPNVRLITLSASPITAEDLRRGYLDFVIRVYGPDAALVAGPKRCLAYGPKSGMQTSHFLFAADEFPVVPGAMYRIEIQRMLHQESDQAIPPAGRSMLGPRDLRARVYGEPEPGAMPAIFNLAITHSSDDNFTHNGVIHWTWSAPLPCRTRIETWGLGINGGQVFEVEHGETKFSRAKFWPGHTYRYRLTSIGPTGLMWRTPVYEARIPLPDRRTFESPQSAKYHERFLCLAPSPRSTPSYEPIRYLAQVEVANGDFEDGLDGWRISGPEAIRAAGSEHDIEVMWGRRMAGFSHLAGRDRGQPLSQTTLTQKIATRAGHTYLLSAWAYTSVDGGAPGGTRVRLGADPLGGDDFEEWSPENVSQWYWTDGRWLRFQQRFVARGDESTIGLQLFRWWDLDRSSAYVDHVTVFDLGPAPAEPSDGTVRTGAPAGTALADHRSEAEDKVEGFLKAPAGYVFTGLGSRAHRDNVTTMWARIQPLLDDGRLGPAEYLRTGWEPDAGLEAEVALPEGMVATGFGAAIAPEWDVKRFRVWARPLRADGTLGEEKEFRGGVDRISGVEKQVRLEPQRVLTSAGLNCMHNDINGIRADSARVVRSVTAAL